MSATRARSAGVSAMRRLAVVASTVAIVGGGVAVASAGTGAGGPTTSALATSAAPSATAQPYAGAAVRALQVKGRAPMTGYSRSAFGPEWADTDRNGCDTRNDVLRRDLRDVTLKAGTRGCTVLTGTLRDPYTDATISFARGPASGRVQVDHVVALADAWAKGAQQWSAAQRVAFANDSLNLLAVDGPTNQRKGAADAATWLPPAKAHRCQYVARQAAVKQAYALSVTASEQAAMLRVLGGCPSQRLATATAFRLGAGATADPTPTPPPAPTPSAAVAPTPSAAVTYAICAAVRAAGAAPIRPGDPGWDPTFDGDGDGIGCE